MPMRPNMPKRIPKSIVIRTALNPSVRYAHQTEHIVAGDGTPMASSQTIKRRMSEDERMLLKQVHDLRHRDGGSMKTDEAGETATVDDEEEQVAVVQ